MFKDRIHRHSRRAFLQAASALGWIGLIQRPAAPTACADAPAAIAPEPDPFCALACRLANYGPFAASAWAHLPSIGVRYVFMDAPASDQVDAVRQRLAQCSLTPVVLRANADLSQPAGLDHLDQQLAACARLGVPYLFLSPKRRDTPKAAMYDRLRQAGRRAARHGVVIALETHPDLGANAGEHLETMARVDHPNVRVNFDTGNIHFYNAGARAADELEKIIDHVATVEVKDHNGKAGDWHFPALGRGIVDFPRIFRILDQHRYRGPVTIEIEGIQGVPRTEPEIKQDIEDSVAFLRSLRRFR